ncbi:MAG: UDP-2,3-diacylglucosamine diphosphatase [Gammaproteobacteria bacterium]|nr:UDP-2,3-diacylglucosamine diphosphatase [Gammaproteobacteria bacterium]
MSTLFISDLHLSAERPEKLEAFKFLLTDVASQFESIYILGDLFEEFWVGDDDRTPPNPEILSNLKSCTDSGVQVFFIRGNRELLLQSCFRDQTGVTVLADISEITVAGKKTLIMHGDQLCTLDSKYQLFRTIMTNNLVQFLIRILPYGFRTRLAHGLRPGMTRHKDTKTSEMLDVDQSAVTTIMNKHNASILIHGHTHKPGIHHFRLHNEPAKRIVLGDWYGKGEILVYTEDKFELMCIEDVLSKFKPN